jgi:NO-binding membrane sensor protein with MHYT domain
MKNQISYSIAASVIAISAVTAALFIFFKLREQWANQWYKRLGCAMLMAVAACGTKLHL